MPSKDQVQIRITKPGKHFIAEGYVRQGQVLWVSQDTADRYINKEGLAEPAAAQAGPTEFKEGNESAGDDPATRSTGLAKSSEDGTVRQSSVSQADRVSQPSNASKSEPKKRGRKPKSA